jgi:hypothetical protein
MNSQAQKQTMTKVHSHQLLRNPVPTPTNLRSPAHVSQVAQHAAIANLGSLARLIGLVLHVWAHVFEDALEDVFV